jgi:hypothetical protein
LLCRPIFHYSPFSISQPEFYLEIYLFLGFFGFLHIINLLKCAVLVIISGIIMCQKNAPEVYQPREPEKSPFFQLVSSYFDKFERIYPEKYQKTYGFWRPVIRRSIDKFIKCGDLKEGFARVKCTACNKEMFVPFSCRQRCCCPSCHQKRVLLLAYHLGDELEHYVHFCLFFPESRSRLILLGIWNQSAFGGLPEFLSVNNGG